ncbi:MAG: phosphatidate cytidylyltransferase [Candidatus Eisenbacteria bacterium]|nr:phosphatidate cytidylyltransferase [Candidatus Eisenbacteria bacterium]
MPPDAMPGAHPRVAAVPAKRGGWSLRLRIVSALLFVPLLIVMGRAGGFVFLALVAAEVTLGLLEFYRMMFRKGLQPYVRLGLASALGLLWVTFRPHTPQVDFLLTAVLLLTLALELRRPEARQRVEDMAVTAFGVMYVGWLSAHFVRLRELPWAAGTAYGDGASYVFLAFFITWSCDTGAYAVGRVFGRRRPWVAISPRKSLEGAIGGLLCAILAAFAARSWFAHYLKPLDAAALGILVGVFAQVGDLVESLLKRDTAHGDSSDFIPGHGGILDRFDSLYFAAPLVFYYLKVVVFGVP